jgi:hypothetical protein
MPILFGRHSAQLFGLALMIERVVLAEPVVPTETSLLCDSISVLVTAPFVCLRQQA